MLCESGVVSLWPSSLSNISVAALPDIAWKTATLDFFLNNPWTKLEMFLNKYWRAKTKAQIWIFFHKLRLTLQNIWLSFFSSCVYQKSDVSKIKRFWKKYIFEKSSYEIQPSPEYNGSATLSFGNYTWSLWGVRSGNHIYKSKSKHFILLSEFCIVVLLILVIVHFSFLFKYLCAVCDPGVFLMNWYLHQTGNDDFGKEIIVINQFIRHH